MDHIDHPAKRRRLSAYQNGSDTGKGLVDEGQGYVLDGGDMNHGSIEIKNGATREEISISSTSKLAGQTIAPFLAQHIPEQLAHVGPSSTKAASPQKTMNSKYCYRHRPDLKCRRKADEPSTDQMQHVSSSSRIVSLCEERQSANPKIRSSNHFPKAINRALLMSGRSSLLLLPNTDS